MGVTISTHNGSSVARDHNIRNRKVTDKESHIDPNGVYEIWHDEKLTDAYHRLFDGAVERYNAKQSRADRRIENYLAAIQKDAAKKPVYEMIIGVYGADCSNDAKKDILRQFVDGWKERNPNLELIGAYYHADEEGQDPHVHIDYIPVAHGYKRGMDTQNGLVKALEEQGVESGKSMKETAQIFWERRENNHLEALCNARGLVVEHPGTGKKHLDTPEYKQLQDELQKANEKIAALTAEVHSKQRQVDALSERIQKDRSVVTDLNERIRNDRQEQLRVYSSLTKGREELREVNEELTVYTERLEEVKDEYYAVDRESLERNLELEEATNKLQSVKEQSVKETAKLTGIREQIEREEGVLERLRAAVDELKDTAAAKYNRLLEAVKKVVNRLSPAAKEEFEQRFAEVSHEEKQRALERERERELERERKERERQARERREAERKKQQHSHDERE